MDEKLLKKLESSSPTYPKIQIMEIDDETYVITSVQFINNDKLYKRFHFQSARLNKYVTIVDLINKLADKCQKTAENAIFNFYTDFDYEAIAKRKALHLYDELIRRGAPRHSALFDVALTALHDKGSELSDNAAEIITSEEYLNIS